MKMLEKMSKNLSIVLVLSMLAVLFAPACNVTAEAVDTGASATVSVNMAVIGPDGEALYNSANVTGGAITVTDDNQWGLTALGVLDASGVEYESGYMDPWGNYPNSIAGISNEGGGGLGWNYTYNDEGATMLAGNQEIQEGDTIIYYYMLTGEDVPPAWDELNPAPVEEVTVNMAVIGPEGEVLYNSANVTGGAITVTDDNQWGLTALGALDASEVEYESGYMDPWGNYPNSIAGISNEGGGGLGWNYTYNDEGATMLAGNQEIQEGDTIIYYYMSTGEDVPPAWDELNPAPVEEVTVNMAVIGPEGEVLYNSANVTGGAITVTDDNQWGLTALGALDSSGVEYEYEYWEKWGYFPSSIAGIDNDYENGKGWNFTFNGESAMALAGNQEIQEGNAIIYYYMETGEEVVPTWDELNSVEEVTVNMAVIGHDGEMLYNSANVTGAAITVADDNQWGLTALGALDASGIEFTIENCPVWGDYPSSIAGIENDGTSWKFSVNDGEWNDAIEAGSTNITSGDEILWQYTSDESVESLELGEIAVEILYQKYQEKGITDQFDGVYVLYILDKAGVDFSSWEYSGEKYTDSVIAAVETDIINESTKPVSIEELVHDLAAMKALEQSDLYNQLVELIESRDAEGYNDSGDSQYEVFEAYDLLGHLGMLDIVDGAQAREYIMSRMNTEDVPYTWGFVFGGYYVDYTSTVKCLRVLNYLDPNGEDVEIQEVISTVLEWIENSQLPDGSFIPEGGVSGMDCPVAYTAYTIDVMDAFDIEYDSWTSEEGKTAVDYLVNNSINGNGSIGKGYMSDVLGFINAYYMMDNIFYIDPAAETIKVGDSFEINAMLKGIDGIEEITDGVVWTVADESIAEVNDGVVTGLMEGETMVQATYNGSVASAIITVEPESTGGGSWEAPSEVKVSMAVVGPEGKVVVEPMTFEVKDTEEWGLAALAALIASGEKYHLTQWKWGWYPDMIAGVYGNGGGWSYAINDVNGSELDACSDAAPIEEDDKIVFYYAYTMQDTNPLWSDIKKAMSGSFGGSAAVSGEADTVSDKDLRNALEDAESAGQVSLEAENSKIALTTGSDQMDQVVDSEKCLEVTVQGARFLLSPECLGLMGTDSSDYENIQFMAEKLSDWEIENNIAPFNGKLRLAGDIYELDIMSEDSDGELQKVCDLTDCTIVIDIPEGFRQAAEAGTLMAYWYDEENEKWQYTGGVCDAENMTMSFKVKHFSKYALLSSTASFDDVFGHWAQKEIEFMAANDYVNGVGENAFDAQSSITRAQFVAILARMSGLEVDYDNMKTFSDVGGDAWYSREVNIAVSNGIVNGVDAERFDPDGLVTREQIVTMIKRYLDIVGDSQSDETVGNAILSRFADGGEISTWAEEAVAFAVNEELVKGRGADKFVPGGNATRAEAAVMLFRMLQWMFS